MKKKISWKVWSSMAACFALAALLGISTLYSTALTNKKPPIGMKPVINFEGIVASVHDNSVTLKDGRIILITADTQFMGDPDTNHAVSEDILVGNFIQGYTEDAAGAPQITAVKIWTNEGCTTGSEKRAINFEGRITKAEQGLITLDNGKTVLLTEDTLITSPDGGFAKLTEGDYIQGYAENAAEDEITAKYILITPL